jgi:hypothetical protein
MHIAENLSNGGQKERRIKAVVRKGMDPQYDSYSDFQDDGRVRGDRCRSIGSGSPPTGHVYTARKMVILFPNWPLYQHDSLVVGSIRGNLAIRLCTERVI